MFEELPDQWLPATFSSRLGKDKPVAVTVDGADLAVFRDPAGQAVALLDRCPHRGVRLSQGQVDERGLVCPFHGWTFGVGGACVHVPLNPDARRDLLCARALPVVERGGLVWVYTSLTTSQPPPLPPLIDSLEDPSLGRRELAQTWSAHWTRAMENMLDIPHLPWVHRKTIGGQLARRPDLLQAQVRYDLEESAYGFKLSWSFGDEADPGHLQWRRPTGMVLFLPSPIGELRQHVFCVPGARGKTTMMIISTSRKPWWARLIPHTLFEGFEDRILLEDQRVVEGAPSTSVLEATDERSVASDKPTLRFRAWLRQTVAARAAADTPSPAGVMLPAAS